MKPVCRTRSLQAAFIIVAAVFAAACGNKNIKQAAGAKPETTTAVMDEGPDADGREGSLRNKEYRQITELTAVHFGYDRAELSESGRQTLRDNAALIKKRQGAEIQVAGHCDERGTSQYNLALGQRRANAVRNYYKFLGIPMDRMSTISYGEEAPLCNEYSEECWTRNRRAETLLRIK